MFPALRAPLASDTAVQKRIADLLAQSEDRPGKKRKTAMVTNFEELTGRRLFGSPFVCQSGLATPQDVVYFLVLLASKR